MHLLTTSLHLHFVGFFTGWSRTGKVGSEFVVLALPWGSGVKGIF
jgi:hypothetical protein